MNRDVRRKNFNEIAEQLHVTEEECKKKLKHLKDKMWEVCSKLPKTANGQPAFQAGEEIVRWQFYKPLLFLKDQFIGRQLSGSFHENQAAGTSQSQDLDGDDDDDEESLSSHPGVETTADNTTSSRSATPVAAPKRPHEGNAWPRLTSSDGKCRGILRGSWLAVVLFPGLAKFRTYATPDAQLLALRSPAAVTTENNKHDDEKTLHLISLLQDYPSLWKKHNKDFMNRDVRRKNFNEIAEQLHVAAIQYQSRKTPIIYRKVKSIDNNVLKEDVHSRDVGQSAGSNIVY
ncbi:hypothetical protein ElyMa_006543600 [Elysia marginata]|uniref:MADF domain-containing protein n=1 Tax=Elysia marginata TaxID=1093978 RepID=A0AAV4IA17_9GAST|nr:hypothetical protein ElyMa_006543600 [Elysia marginata]